MLVQTKKRCQSRQSPEQPATQPLHPVVLPILAEVAGQGLGGCRSQHQVQAGGQHVDEQGRAETGSQEEEEDGGGRE